MWCLTTETEIGLPEATWGADPLEYEGGFKNLTYDPRKTFHTSLSTNGTAAWNETRGSETTNGEDSASASLSISYSNVDWNFLKEIYGWSAVQYQAWARGELIVGGNETQHVILYTDGILELWVDDHHYFGGDYYTLRRAPPVLHLTPGVHRLDLRLVRDVRAFGGILEPTIDVVVAVERVSGTLELARSDLLLSDVVNGTLASPVGSVYLRNSGEHDVEVIGVGKSNVSLSYVPLSFTRAILLRSCVAEPFPSLRVSQRVYSKIYMSCASLDRILGMLYRGSQWTFTSSRPKN